VWWEPIKHQVKERLTPSTVAGTQRNGVEPETDWQWNRPRNLDRKNYRILSSSKKWGIEQKHREFIENIR
jgi:hypothetical protein